MCLRTLRCLGRCFCFLCPPLYRLFFSDCNQKRNLRCTSFICGFLLGQAYYYYLLKRIPFPNNTGFKLSLVISLLLGIGNAISIQIRCICLLIFPMYCGKAGRGVLKAVVLTYVVAGPITNMGLNAREVVRVFACSTQLSFNLTKERYSVMAGPFKKTAVSLERDMNQMKDALRSFRGIVAPIEHEVCDYTEVDTYRDQSNSLDTLMRNDMRSDNIEDKYHKIPVKSMGDYYQSAYEKKLEYRCYYKLTQASAVCIEAFTLAYENCYYTAPPSTSWMLCWPLRLQNICNFMQIFHDSDTCNSRKQIGDGVGDGFATLENAKQTLSENMDDIHLKYKIKFHRKLYDYQDAKETGERVLHSFEEKHNIMELVIITLNVFMALLFLRIVMAAVTYHDMYLTSINFDNIYITSFFKKLDKKRKKKHAVTLLPLKKMERNKYIDVHSLSYITSQHGKLVTQILKVMLEVVTATTFVMLDRLFFEALDVVRQHAQSDVVSQGTQDLKIEVEGTGFLASLLRRLVSNLSSAPGYKRAVSNRLCIPHPRAMPPIYFLKIYGGYVWILLLLYVNPYTLRLRRLICSYFYPCREKQRVLHLYNDILKKRMKMEKTLRRKAVQAVRAHYLSGENLLSLRMKFPYMLGWLDALPAARMTCLICGETKPRPGQRSSGRWHCCSVPNCPFVYCAECWQEAGSRCLACDPSLNELSDVDSLSDDDQPRY
ncbi:protein sneaky [Helicoverpa armigera]|uniref:protein sneaky n=1 Tax=Helicoverpa armigera TaxID=29058 RepID=UPI003083B169